MLTNLKHLVMAMAIWECICGFDTEHYRIDPNHTYSQFAYQHWALSTQRGRFDKSSGAIDFDPDSRQGHVLIEIDSTSINTGSALFDSILRSEAFFDTGHFPKIVFESVQLIFDGDRMTRIDGNLTIKNTTRAVQLDVTRFNCRFMPLYFRRACGADGQTAILRSDFGMGRYAPFVSDEVTLLFSVEGIQEDNP